MAVLDGCDGFILSHETSVGEHPLEATVLLAKANCEVPFAVEVKSLNGTVCNLIEGTVNIKSMCY